jgi:20S proteasome subunit beta 4
MKEREDKILDIDKSKLLAASGDTGDRVQFTEYIKRNIALYELRLGHPMSTHAAANYTRQELSEALRRNPYQVNMLLGGYDADVGPSLYYLDYLGALNKMDFAAQGYASYFLLGLFDKHWKKGMSLEEGKQLMELCFQQLKTRLVLDTSNWHVKYVDKEGIHVLQD